MKTPAMALARAQNRIERVKTVRVEVLWRNGKRSIYKGSRK